MPLLLDETYLSQLMLVDTQKGNHNSCGEDKPGLPASNYPLLQPRPYPRLLSLVIPLYNEEAVIGHLRTAVEKFITNVKGKTEVILVNDGSSDGTLAHIACWAAEDPQVKIVDLSRNFGHQSAATAGLDYASGEAVVLLDADLQDPLTVIHDMIDRYREGYDVAYGQRIARDGENWWKRFTAWLFYRLMRALVYKDLPVDAGDFRLISRHCLDGLQQLTETHRFLRGMVAWVGYSQVAVPYKRSARIAGESKYPLRKMLTFAWTAATSFSGIPLKVSTLMGVITTLLGMEEGLRAILAHLFHWYVVPGWSSLVVLVSIIGGAMLISIGVLGEYVSKVYEQSKRRPLYLVSRTFNMQKGHAEAVLSHLEEQQDRRGSDVVRTFS
jgi:polyisoprenyl-phosphate glycosyltransferase